MAEGAAIIEGRKRHRNKRYLLKKRLKAHDVIGRIDEDAQTALSGLRLFDEGGNAEDRFFVRTGLAFLRFDDPWIVGHETGFFRDFCHLVVLALRRLAV